MKLTKISRRIRRRPQVELLEGRTLLNAGDLDLTFGGTGMVTTAIGSYTNIPYAVAVQSDGKVVDAGYSTNSVGGPNQFTVVRYNTDGSLDSTFGSGGIAALSLTNPNTGFDVAYAVAIQPTDGKILAGGIVNVPPTSKKGSTLQEWALVRFNTNGSLDKTFGGGSGEVFTNVSQPAFWEAILSIKVQSDGKIVAVGQTGASGSKGYGIGLVRYNTDGSLDASFGNGGVVINSVVQWEQANYGGGFGNILAIEGNGDIDFTDTIYTSSGTNVMGVARYLPNGTVDTSFGSGGVVTFMPPGGTSMISRSLALQSTGKIVVFGQSNITGGAHPITLVRLNSDGSLDTTFGSGGVYEDSRLFVSSGLAIQPADDKIVAVAKNYSPGGTSFQFAVTRVLADGSSADSSFGTNGIGMTSFPTGGLAPWPYAVSLGPDGRIVVAGLYNTGSRKVFATARFLGDSSSSQPALASIITNLGATVPTNVDPVILPLVLDDNAFLNSLPIGKHRKATAQ